MKRVRATFYDENGNEIEKRYPRFYIQGEEITRTVAEYIVTHYEFKGCPVECDCE